MLARFLRIALLILLSLGFWLGYRWSGWVDPSMPTPVRLCWSALGGVLIPAVATCLTVLLTAVLSRDPEHSRGWLQSVVGESWATLILFVGRQPWAWTTPSVRLSQGASAQVPVVLVHGYLCNHRIWDAMAVKLLDRGHPLLAVDLEPIFASIDDYADIVERAVQQLRQTTGAQQVALVGHSMGGLAIRAWMRRYGMEHCAGVLTLGTPHQGTQLARASHTPNGRQMQFNSQWLQDLARTETPAHRALIRIAITAHDNIVFAQHAQTLEDTEVTVFQGFGHLQMCTDPAVTEWVLAQLQAMPFQSEAPISPLTP